MAVAMALCHSHVERVRVHSRREMHEPRGKGRVRPAAASARMARDEAELRRPRLLVDAATRRPPLTHTLTLP